MDQNNFMGILGSFAQPFYQVWWMVMPVLLFYLFAFLWDDYVKGEWSGKMEWTMIEIIPPKDLEKGPKLMESIYQGLCGVVVSYNAFDEYVMGMFTDKFSFELVGLGGEVHFYVRVQKKFRNLLEAQIYAQYPDAEILEVDDYVNNFPRVVPNSGWNLWGSDMVLIKPDAYPLRTYDKFEEDITGTMIDPIAGFVELFASTPPGQNMWLQIIVQPLEEVWRKKSGAEKEIQKLAGRAKESRGLWSDVTDVFTNLFKALWQPVEFPSTKKEEQPLEFRLTPVEKDVLKAVEENLGKNQYKIKMRFIYVGKREGFDMGYVTGFFGVTRQFNDLNLNGIKPDDSKTTAHFVAIDTRLDTMKRRIYERYRKRNTDGKTFVFSTSELATIYHFPDMAVRTPALSRVESKRGTAPSNLPTA